MISLIDQNQLLKEKGDMMSNEKDDSDSGSKKPVPRKPVTVCIERGSPKEKQK